MRRAWRHLHGARHGVHRRRERHDGDREFAHRDQGVREREDHAERSGGGAEVRGGYRIEEGSRQFSRSEYSQDYGAARVIERDSFRVGPRCLTACPGLNGGPRRFDFTGIDARGYLVWPGKVEY
jgi:hypothetical protein